MRSKTILLFCLMAALLCGGAFMSIDKNESQSTFGPLAKVSKGEFQGYINAQGKLVTPLRERIKYLGEGYIYMSGGLGPDTILNLNTGKMTSYPGTYNYLSKSYKGKIIASHRSNKYGAVIDFEMNELLRLDKHNDGLRVIPWDGIDGHIIVASFTYGYGEPNKQKYGIVNVDDGLVISYDYDGPGELGKNFWVTKKNDKTGVLNLKGEIIIPFKYERIFTKHGGNFDCVINKKENTRILLDRRGKEVKIPGIYDSVRLTNGGKYMIAEKNDKEYLLDHKGNKILPNGYREIIIPYGIHDFVCYQTGWNLCKCIDTGKTYEWPEEEKDLCCPYSIGDFGESIYIKSLEKKCEYNPHFSYHYDGEKLTPLDDKFSSLRYGAGVIIANHENKRWIVTNSLEIVADISEYDEVENFSY